MRSLPLPDPITAKQLLGELAESSPRVGPHPVDLPLVLYGAGNLGRMAADLLGRLDIPIEYVIDRSPPPDGVLAGRIPVMKPEHAPCRHHDTHLVAVCVVTSSFTPIHESLRALGWRNICHVYDITEAYGDRIPMGNGWFTGPLDQQDVERLEWVLSRWTDDESRAAHLQWIAWRAHRMEWEFPEAPVRIENRYFIDPLLDALTPGELFFDAGAYHGAVIERFLHTVGDVCESIVAVEPDRENAAVLRANLAGLSTRCAPLRIRLLEFALGARKETGLFCHGLDLAARLSRQGTGTVQVNTIDGIGLPVSFLKLHLEGGEWDALMGGLNTLRRYRPLLAVTLYHRRDGLWRIPSLLMEVLGGYEFRMRLHGWAGTGCVMYCIPEERRNGMR